MPRSEMRPATLTTLKALNILTFLAVAIVNSLAGSTSVIAGTNNKEVSGRHPTFLTPSGWAFSIWGLIYLFLAGFSVYQALPSAPQDIIFKGVNVLWIVNGWCNVFWIIAFNYEVMWLSELLMIIIFGTLLAIYLRIGQYWSSALSWVDYLLIYVPFSLYFGWTTVAAIINTYIVSTSLEGGVDGYYAKSSVAGLAIAGVLGTTATCFLERRDGVYGAVIVWGLIAVWTNQAQVPVVRDATMFFAGWLIGCILVVDIGYRVLDRVLHNGNGALSV